MSDSKFIGGDLVSENALRGAAFMVNFHSSELNRIQSEATIKETHLGLLVQNMTLEQAIIIFAMARRLAEKSEHK